MAKQDEHQFVRVEDYVKGELSKETNWWGAFVVGLAGTILVTGVTPAVLAPLGAAATLHVVEEGDHSFKVPKRGPVTQEEVFERVQEEIARWIGGLIVRAA